MRALALAAVCFAASLAHAGNVHIVGGPASTATTIQLAVDAAVDGDVVLVRTTPLAGFVVDGKSLTIVGDVAGATLGTRVEIRNVSAPRSVALRGFTLSTSVSEALLVQDCSAHVRIDGCQVSVLAGIGSSKHALRVSNCADVALQNSTFAGAPGILPWQNEGSALHAESSTIEAVACDFAGGRGTDGGYNGLAPIAARAGAAAIALFANDSLTLRGSSAVGGTGGDGTPATCFPIQHAAGVGGTGGFGIVSSTPAVVTSLSSFVSGGAGGNGGTAAACTPTPLPTGAPGVPGTDVNVDTTLVSLPDATRGLVADALTREQQLLHLTVTGVPGDLATLLISQMCQRNEVPSFRGAVLVGPAFRRIALGVVPGSGILNASLPIADLQPAVQASPRYLQAFCRDAGGQVHMTGCASVVLLDAAY